MAFITRDQFLAADDLPTVEVPLPEAYGEGAVMLLRTLTGTERAKLENRYSGETARSDTGGFRAAILAAVCIEENGDLMFTQEDAAVLLEKNAATLETIVTAASELCGFTKKDVDQLAKNSDDSP